MARLVCAALLKKDRLDLSGATELLRQIVEAAMRNPDMGAGHTETKRYAEALAKWEAEPI